MASDCGARAACRREGATTDLGGGGGEQRTSNMASMFVTRDVSQLSGWLKALADWRGSQAGHTVRGAGCGPQEAERGEQLRCARSMQARGRDYRFGRRGRGAAHVKHGVHVRDAGRVPAKRLVEGRRGLARVASRAHGARGGLRATGGGTRRAIAVRAQHAQARGRDYRFGRRGRGAAHVKHAVHVRDAGRVPAERLVEGRRVLPRVASRAHGARGGLRAGRWNAASDCAHRDGGATVLLNCGPQRLGSELKSLVRYLPSTVHNSYRNRSHISVTELLHYSPKVRYIISRDTTMRKVTLRVSLAD